MNSQNQIFFSPIPYSIYAETFGNQSKNVCVFIPGGYHSGVGYVQTPDGRNGWAKLAADLGYYSIVTDMPGTGRSGSVPFELINSQFIVDGYRKLIEQIDGDITLFVHSISGSYGFKLLEMLPNKIKRLVAVEPSMFGNIQQILIPIKETESTVTVNFHGLDFTLDMTKTAPPSKQSVDRFTTINNPDKKLFPKYSEIDIAQYTASLQNIHPQLLYELFNIKESKLKINDFNRLSESKILVITSPDDPLHKEEDIKVVSKLREENCNVEHWEKGSHGTAGNSHMMMLEKNNVELFNEIHNWISKN